MSPRAAGPNSCHHASVETKGELKQVDSVTKPEVIEVGVEIASILYVLN